MTLSRYEVKFIVSHAKARNLLGFVKDALIPDSNGESARYRVTSVYFDSPTHNAYWDKIDGESSRRKLRLRYYGHISGNELLNDRPYFLELKYRIKDTVYKDRIKIRNDFAQEVLLDPTALQETSGAIDTSDPTALAIAHSIENYSAGSWLRATDTVSYEREAWQGAVDDRVRLTFDRVVHVYPPEVFTNIDAISGLPIVRPDRCVMEVKFNNYIPTWLREALVVEKLSPRRFSKYATGLEVIGTISARRASEQIVAKSVINERAILVGV